MNRSKLTLKSLTCLGLAIGGAALVATASAPVTATAVAAGLMTAAAGNQFHELFGAAEEWLPKIFRQHPGIDENHHILLALRQAHLAALGEVTRRFETTFTNDHDEARRERCAAFAEKLRSFIGEAGKQGGVGTGAVSQTEREVFLKLPEGFDAAQAACGTRPAAVIAQQTSQLRIDIEEAVLAEVLEATGTLADAVPRAFSELFAAPEQGWFGLFVRDAADRLKQNEAFRLIWEPEKLARIAAVVEGVAGQVDRVETKIDQVLEIVQLIMERTTSDNAIQLQGHISARTVLHNDTGPMDDVIFEARALEAVDPRAALERLDRYLDEDDSVEKAIKNQAEAEAHRVRMERMRARGYFEKASIQQGIFEHRGAIESLEVGLGLDPNAVRFWIELGIAYEKINNSDKAKIAFESARDAAMRQGDKYGGE